MARLPAYFDFRWPVPVEGFRWQELAAPAEKESGSELALLPISPAARDYYPLRDYTGLFLLLAELEPTPDAILAFANQYGTLEHFSPWERRLAGPPSGQHTISVAAPWSATSPPAVSLADFPEEIRSVLEKTVRTEPPEVAVSWLKDWKQEIALLHHEVGSVFGFSLYARSMKADDRIAINDHIRRRLVGHIVPLLGEESVECAPTTLLGAVWLQLALAVAHNKQYRRCEAPACPRVWFEVSKAPFGLRPEARYCSPPCRTRAWLAKKAKR